MGAMGGVVLTGHVLLRLIFRRVNMKSLRVAIFQVIPDITCDDTIEEIPRTRDQLKVLTGVEGI